MSALREVVAKLTFDVDDAPLKKGSAGVDRLTDTLQKAGAAVGASLVYDKVKEFTLGVIDMGDEIGDTAEKLGVSTDALQFWRFAAESMGAEASELGTGFKILTKQAGEAALGNKEAGETFKKIGVDIKDASGRTKDSATLFHDVGLALADVEDPAIRSTLAMKIFGKSGTALLPLFSKGSAGLDELSAKFDKLGGGLSGEALGALGDADQALRENELAVRRLKGELSIALIPTFTRFVDGVSEGSRKAEELTKGTNALQIGVGALASVAGVAAIGMAAPYAPFILTAGAAVASITDVSNAFTSGNSKMLDFMGKVDKFLTGKDVGKLANKEAKDFGQDVADNGFDVAQGNVRQRLAVGRARDRINQIDEVERSGKGFTEFGGQIFQQHGKTSLSNRSVAETLQLIRMRREAEAELSFAKSGGLQKGAINDFATNAVSQATVESADVVNRDRLAADVAAALNPMFGMTQTANVPQPQPVKQDVKVDIKTNHQAVIQTQATSPDEIGTAYAAAAKKADAASIEQARNAIVPALAAGQ